MSKRYSSVDRSKEMRNKRLINSINPHRNLILRMDDFDINNVIEHTKKNILNTLNPKRIKPKKLPKIIKQITTSHLGEINSKTTDLSTEVNNAFLYEKENNEKNNILKTEANKDINQDNYYKIVINSDFRDKSSVNSSKLTSANKIIKQKIKIQNKFKEENKKVKYPPILKSERLYPRKNIDNNAINIRKKIKSIRNHHLSLKNKSISNGIAYDSKFENVVFDANNLLNKHTSEDNDLKVNDNLNSFINKNKELFVSSLLLNLIKKENKIAKENFEIRNKAVENLKELLTKDEKDFEYCTEKQKKIYYETSDIYNKIRIRNYDLARLLYMLDSKHNSLEDEIFKMIEQIESLRIYAKFVTRLLGGNEQLFEGKLIPNYENESKPDINILIQKVYSKYGNLLKKHKLTMTTNTYYTINNLEKNKNSNDDLNSQEEPTIEEIDFELLNDPYLMLRKYKEIEERIINLVEKYNIFEKYANKEHENNEQILEELKERIIKLEKEYEYSKRNLMDFKNILDNKDSKENENKEYYNLIKEMCNIIFEFANDKKENNIKKAQNKKDIDIFELNSEVSKCINLLIKKEDEVNKYISNLESYEKTDKKLFSEFVNERRHEIKYINQNQNKTNINNGDFKKQYKINDKFYKVILKYKKSEPPYYKMKKEVVVKDDKNEIINRENSELMSYK